MIDCYFHEGDLTPAEIMEQQLVENLASRDISEATGGGAGVRL